jgi:hypothetical protein
MDSDATIDIMAEEIADLVHALRCTQSFLRVGKFDDTNVAVLTEIIRIALREPKQE